MIEENLDQRITIGKHWQDHIFILLYLQTNKYTSTN